jgi:hypothetical protein
LGSRTVISTGPHLTRKCSAPCSSQ